MASFVKIRAISRSQQVRIAGVKITRSTTVAVDLDVPAARRDLERFQALGSVIVVGGLTSSVGDAVTSGGVVDGGATQTDMALRVTAGTLRTAAGNNVAIVAGTPSVTAADGTNPRVDNVVVNLNSGVVTIVAGAAAASPVAPAIVAGTLKIAEVYVPANDTGISDDQITDWAVSRYVVAAPSLAVTSGGVVDGGTNQADLILRVTAGTLRTPTGATVAIVAGTPTVSAADGTNPRIDNVVVNTTTGVVTIVAGTAAGSPVAPLVQPGTLKIAEVSVPALDTSIADNQITDWTISRSS